MFVQLLLKAWEIPRPEKFDSWYIWLFVTSDFWIVLRVVAPSWFSIAIQSMFQNSTNYKPP